MKLKKKIEEVIDATFQVVGTAAGTTGRTGKQHSLRGPAVACFLRQWQAQCYHRAVSEHGMPMYILMYLVCGLEMFHK